MSTGAETSDGLSGAAKRVAEHARALAGLEVELARAELRRKLAALGIGLGLVVAAGLFALVSLWFLFGAVAAAIALALPVWTAILLTGVGLLLLAAVLGAVGVALIRRGAPPVPEQAIEEARLTTEALRSDGRT